MRTLGAVKPQEGHRPEVQGSNFPITRLGGMLYMSTPMTNFAHGREKMFFIVGKESFLK